MELQTVVARQGRPDLLDRPVHCRTYRVTQDNLEFLVHMVSQVNQDYQEHRDNLAFPDIQVSVD